MPPSPVLVHCANGLGKTGVVIATHFALKAFTAEETLDLTQIVKKVEETARPNDTDARTVSFLL